MTQDIARDLVLASPLLLTLPATWVTARRGVLAGIGVAAATFLTVCLAVYGWEFATALFDPWDPDRPRFGAAGLALGLTIVGMAELWALPQTIGIVAAGLWRWTRRKSAGAQAARKLK